MDLLRDGHVSYILAERGISGGATSFFEDHAGRLWVGIDETLSIYKGKFRPITRKNGSPIGMVYSIAEDTENNIWVESSGPLTRIRDFKVEEELPSAQVPAGYRVVADPKKGIWLGLVNGDLARYQDGQAEAFHFQHAVKSRVEQLTVNPDGSVLGTTASGLVGWRSGKQATLTTQNGLPCEIAYDSILDAQGDLWIYMQCGLVEIKKADLQNWWDHPDAKLQPRLFDVFDGAQPGRAPFSGATRSPDGKLWFASGVVLQTIDPDHLALNSVLPPVHVEGITADHRNYSAQDGLRLPPLTRDVEVDYTALSFVAPQKVRFRYKLEGRDTAWLEPGTRRQAFYTDLRPGRYKFRVIACNNDGVWNEQGATLDFAVAPAWYQTTRFLVLCLLSTVFIFWALYRLRVRQVARAISARFDERLAERTRLAREIHDTLVQTIQGSKMVADDALDEATDFPRMRQAMERLSVWLGQATEEGRAALNSLRTSTTQTNDLAESFRRALHECRIQGFPDAVFVAEGKATEMHPIVRDEIYRIGYEAIRNACQHSEATRLEVHLSYSRDLALRITDNGKGIAPEVVARGKDGHYGLQGMRERADRISGKLNLTTSPGLGTNIELVVPGRIVFRGQRSGWSTRMKDIFRGPTESNDLS
jgi:signal transduction histidine kinase